MPDRDITPRDMRRYDYAGCVTGTLSPAMPRPATGVVESYPWGDGRTVTYRLRVRAFGKRWRVQLGTNHQGWSRDRALVECERVMGQIERGTWTPPARSLDTPKPHEQHTETFHRFISAWWAEKQRTLTERGRDDYRWRIEKLLSSPTLRSVSVADIDRRAVDSERARLIRHGLGARSVNMVLSLLAQVLDQAVDYEILAVNPARGRRQRVKEPPKRRAALDPDMVVDVLEEAGRLERAARAADRYGRRAVLAMLCLAGPRIAEALDVPRSDLDLHGGRVRLGRKTQAGLREVELTAYLQGELRAHLAASVALGRPRSADTPLFCTRAGNRHSESQIRARLLGAVVVNVNERRARDGRVLLPHVTPHVLRRTFATLALAAGRQPRWVMAQIGHTDAKLTLSVYEQVIARQQLDRESIWELMRFSDELEHWPGSAKISNTANRPGDGANVPGHGTEGMSSDAERD